MDMLPEFFQDHRLAKRAHLLSSGIDPYPYSFAPTHAIGDLVRDFETLAAEGTVVSCAGRMLSARKMGKSWFVDLIERGDKFQLYVRPDETENDTATLVENMDIGDWVGVSGTLFRTRTGEPTIHAKRIDMLGKSVADVPFGKIHEGGASYTLSSIEIRRQKRYLDWITDPESVRRFELRSRVLSLVRRWMEREGFLEVDVPALEPVYGGAEARPFRTTVWALGGQEVFLRVSLELPLKRYIVGGFPKVFALNSCFRNEGIDATHNPEFTLMEWYEAFSDYEDQMTRFENLTCHVVETITGGLKLSFQGREIDLRPPWKRIRIPDVIREVFGCEFADIDRGSLVADIDRAMTDEKLSFVGITRDQYRAELGEAKLGHLVMEKVEGFLEAEDRIWEPCFLCDHPRDISPLTKVKRGAPDFVERFEPHIAGLEMGNAYSELTDPVEQFERFRAQRTEKSVKGYDTHPIDMDFIHAVGCGMPPTGGVGYGIDRLVMLLTGKESIRDVIAFPMRTGKGE
jgi:lysyl-tRNA synthetase, class II